MRIVVADDHALVREGLTLKLESKYPDAEVLDVGDGRSLLNELQHKSGISLVLMDLTMPNTRPFELLREISRKWPLTKTVVLSASESQHDIDQAMDNGARGYIPKTMKTQNMLSVLDQILKGKVFIPESVDDVSAIEKQPAGKRSQKKSLPSAITPRQKDVLKLMLKGNTNSTIAQELNVSECTVKIHVTNIFKALNVSNRTEAVVKAAKYRI